MILFFPIFTILVVEIFMRIERRPVPAEAKMTFT